MSGESWERGCDGKAVMSGESWERVGSWNAERVRDEQSMLERGNISDNGFTRIKGRALQRVRTREQVDKSKRSTSSTYLLTFTPILSVQMHVDLHADVRMCDSAGDPTFNQRTHASPLVLPRPEGQQLENGEGGVGDKIDARVQ